MNFPPNYQNPTPSGRYNLVILGGGTAGLAMALGAAELGAKVAIVEQSCLGGNQLLGMATKMVMLKEARHFTEVKKSGQILDFQEVLKKITLAQASIAQTHLFEKYADKGIDLYQGLGKFLSNSQIEVEGQILEFSRAVIATGARAANVKGIHESKILTLDTLHLLKELPKKLAVIGSLPQVFEIAQLFTRFGSQVSLYRSKLKDQDAENILRTKLETDGVKFESGELIEENYDKVFSAEERIPNLEGLNLEAAGVRSDEKGIVVNDGLRTTNPKIFVAGDVCTDDRFAQAAEATARTVIANSLFFGRHRVSSLIIPWCIYTDPQIAQVGLYQTQAEAKHFKTLKLSLAELNEGVWTEEKEGFLKIHYDHRGHIKGVIIVASQASEIITELVLAMQYKIKVWNLGAVIHPHPSQSEIIKQAGDAARRTLFTKTVENLLKKIMKWRR